MSGGKLRRSRVVIQETRKGIVLSKDERDTATRMRANRFSWDAVSRALGRSIPDLRSTLDPTWKAG